MSLPLRKDNHSQSHSNSFSGNVIVAGSGNSNASSVSDEFDDETSAATTSIPPPFKSNSTVTASAAASTILGNLSRLSAHHLSSTSNNYRKDYSTAMGGLSIPHHGLSAAFYGYHSHAGQSIAGDNLPPTPTNSNSVHHFSSNATQANPSTNSGCSAIDGAATSSNAASNNNTTSSSSSHNGQSNQFNSSKSSPFLLPAQLYKSLFANAVLHNPDRSHPFPRNLLFSYSDKSPNSPDFDNEEKHTIGDEVSFCLCLCVMC